MPQTKQGGRRTQPVADPAQIPGRQSPPGWAEEAKQVPKADFTVITIHTRSIFDREDRMDGVEGGRGKCVLFVWQHLSDAHLRASDPPSNHQETFCAQADDEQSKTHKQTHLQHAKQTLSWVSLVEMRIRIRLGLGWLGACQAYPPSKQWKPGKGVVAVALAVAGGSNRNVTNKPIKQVLSMKTFRFRKKKHEPHPLQKVELRNYQAGLTSCKRQTTLFWTHDINIFHFRS